jgi:hypothetical protein
MPRLGPVGPAMRAVPGEEHGVGDGVSGVKAGHISNRQLAIYDKRREVLDTGKKGWLAIWNAWREVEGKPPLDLGSGPINRIPARPAM